MTDKELRKLKRAELIEILYYLKKKTKNLKRKITDSRTDFIHWPAKR